MYELIPQISLFWNYENSFLLIWNKEKHKIIWKLKKICELKIFENLSGLKTIWKKIGVLKFIWKLKSQKLEFWKLNLRIEILEINWELEFWKLNYEMEFWNLNLRIGILEIGN